VYRLDRLARDLVLQEQLLAELHRRGKELHSCSTHRGRQPEHSPDDPTRALVRRILGSIAQYEREVIRLRLMAGRQRKALAGGYAGGAPPYGWAAVRGQLVKVPDEQAPPADAPAAPRRASPTGTSCAELERRGIPSRAGPWRPGTVRAILCAQNCAGRARIALPSPEIVEVSA
jgi:hypothetical protein